MKIDAVTIRGFRGFNQEQRINFHPTLTLIYGQNSYGKTSITEAIEWLLYGKTSKVDKGESKEEYKGSYRNCHLGEALTTSVSASFLSKGKPLIFQSELSGEEGFSRTINGKPVDQWPIDSEAAVVSRRIANKPSSSRGIITVEHAVYEDDWIANNTCNVGDRMATAETAINNSYVDASYSPFNSGIDGSPSIKNLGNIVAWFGYSSVSVGLEVSFNGYGSGGRVDTEVVQKGFYVGKYQQIAIEPVTQNGDSGAAYANYNPDTGGWVLVGLHHTKYSIDGIPQYSIGSAIDNVNTYTGTYPYLAE